MMMMMMMMMMVGQVLDHFMRESGGSVEEENQLSNTWSKAEQPGDLAATFARCESDVRASKIEIIKDLSLQCQNYTGWLRWHQNKPAFSKEPVHSPSK